MLKAAFICVHNSCRSQMAEALGRKYAAGVFESYSAGTEIDELPEIDIVITMGCNVQCPSLPCRYREDWGLDDPTGKSDQEFIAVAGKIEEKVKNLAERIKNLERERNCGNERRMSDL